MSYSLDRRIEHLVTFFFLSLVLSAQAGAVVVFQSRGRWPDTWPPAFERFRKQAQSIDVGTGSVECIYMIRFSSRESFERLWPAILEVHSPGGRITLQSPSDDEMYGRRLSRLPMVRIYAPQHRGSAVAAGVKMFESSLDREGELRRQRKEILAKAPWPQHLLDDNQHLPEYVMAEEENGRLRWVRLPDDEDRLHFHYRCRVDIELVVDGQIIDLNRIPLPTGSTIMDLRFK